MGWSLLRIGTTVRVNGRVHTLGSSMVNSYMSVSASVRVNFSTRCKLEPELLLRGQAKVHWLTVRLAGIGECHRPLQDGRSRRRATAFRHDGNFGRAAAQQRFRRNNGRDRTLSYAGDWVTRSIRRRGEPAFSGL
jgi:hypothetical protein